MNSAGCRCQWIIEILLLVSTYVDTEGYYGAFTQMNRSSFGQFGTQMFAIIKKIRLAKSLCTLSSATNEPS